MNHQFSQYKNFRDSGVDWLDNMPSHWGLKRVKEVAEVNNKTLTEKTPDDYEFEYVDIGSVTYGVKGYATEVMTFGAAPSRARRVVKKGDTIISTVRTYLKAITSIETDMPNLIVSTGFAVITPSKKLHPKFSAYWLMSDLIVDRVYALSTGVSYPAVNASIIGDLFFFIPPLEEQQAIADYLDAKTQQIDRKIELLEGKAEKYADLKQSLINETITHGLNKNAPMKSSGLKWVAQIPAHWEIKRAKDLFKKMSRNASETEGIVTAFRDGQVTLRENRRTSGFTNAIFEHGYQGIRTGDLVIHAMDGFAGAIGVSDSDGKSSPVYSAYTPADAKKVYNPYYGLLVREMALSGFVASLGKGIRERSSEFRHKEFAPLELPVPPFEEQKAIADYLETKTAHIEKILETIHLEIEKLQELRKTLINDVVTGKIRVSAVHE